MCPMQALAGLCHTCGLRFLVLCTAAKLFYTVFLVLLKEKTFDLY